MAYSMGSYDNLSIVREPQLFIEFDANSKPTAREEVLRELREIQWPILSVCIIGKYRGGKSWYINRLAGRQKNGPGFGVGAGLTSTTKGIWIWCRQDLAKERMLVFLDTEGLEDVLKTDTSASDNNLCILAMTICDVLLYNVTKIFDQTALENLSFVATVASSMDVGWYEKAFPELIVLVRDVTKAKMDGRKVTGREYLESCLNLETDVNVHNSVRKAITNACVSRDCFLVPIPVKDNDHLEDMDNIGDDMLKPNYLEHESEMKNHIQECKPKCILQGIQLKGQMFTELVTHNVKAVADGQVPSVHSASELLAFSQNEMLQKTFVDQYKMKLHEADITSTDEFDRLHESLKDNAKTMLQQNLIPITATLMTKLQRQFENDIQNAYEKLRSKVELEEVKTMTSEKIEEMERKTNKQKLELERSFHEQREHMQKFHELQEQVIRNEMKKQKEESEKQKQEMQEEFTKYKEEMQEMHEEQSKQQEEQLEKMKQQLGSQNLTFNPIVHIVEGAVRIVREIAGLVAEANETRTKSTPMITLCDSDDSDTE